MRRATQYWKSIAAFVAPGCALLVAGASDGLTRNELLVAGLTCVVSAAAVYAAPRNKQDA
jgi:hypothetical protein